MNYDYDYEITRDYSAFFMFSKELGISLTFYIDLENYDYSPEICLFADALLISLGFVPMGNN